MVGAYVGTAAVLLCPDPFSAAECPPLASTRHGGLQGAPNLCRVSITVKRRLGLLLAFLGLFLVIVTPFSLGMLFLALLLMSSIVLGVFNGFVGLILFIVYIGGTIVLFTYCFMLSPRQTFGSYSKLYPLAATGLGGSFVWTTGPSVYEFYWVSDIVMCIGVLLFIVMLSVVELVDFSRGSMRVI